MWNSSVYFQEDAYFEVSVTFMLFSIFAYEIYHMIVTIHLNGL